MSNTGSHTIKSNVRRHTIQLPEARCTDLFFDQLKFITVTNEPQYQKYDFIQFQAVDHAGCECDHPINDTLFEIVQVSSGRGIMQDFVVLGLSRMVEVAHWEKGRVAFHLTCPHCGCSVLDDPRVVFSGEGEFNHCPNCGRSLALEAQS